MGCGRFKVGDEGQRYEVRCTDGDGKDMGVGWTNEPDGGGLAEGVRLHPSWHSPVVIDRQADSERTD